MEEWREANIFPGRYLVSNLGRIRQVVRYDSRGRKAGGRIIKQDKRDKDGYCIVQLQYKGVIKWPKVHRLVAQTGKKQSAESIRKKSEAMKRIWREKRCLYM